MRQEIRDQVEKSLSRDIASNYDSASSLEESVISEIESQTELTDSESIEIGELCEEWFASHEDDIDDE
mgnify:CR=1 FL=1